MIAGRKIKKVFSIKKNNLSSIFMVPFWLFLGGYCYLRALPTSNKMLEVAGGYENINADQCNIRQNILRQRQQLDEALKCIDWGVSKFPSKHCYALLLIGRADVFIRKECVQDNNFEEVVSWLNHAVKIAKAKEVENEEPYQAIRKKARDLAKNIGGRLT